MTIRRGEEWGRRASLPAHGVIVTSDHEARLVVEQHRSRSEDIPPLGFEGGDLWRALGAPSGGEQRLRSSDAHTVPCDLGVAMLDGEARVFLSHCIIRHPWWLGRVIAVMNVEWFGSWRVAPKAHPNDGVLDVVDASLPWGQRRLARRRLVTGDHLPHPDITSVRRRGCHVELPKPTGVWLDGVRVGAARKIEVGVEPDALTVVV